MISKKQRFFSNLLQKISSNFVERIQIPLFIEIPTKEIESICKHVNNLDSLRCRLIDSCNLFDRINKKQLDKFIGFQTKGSVSCLENTLKKIYSEQHDMINFINEKINLIFLMRDYYTHGKNKHIEKAFYAFGINEKTDSYKAIWIKTYNNLISIFSNFLQITKFNSDLLKQDQLTEDTQELLESMFLMNNKEKLDDDKLKKYIAYLLTEKIANDLEMSKIFNISVFELRQELLDLYPTILKIQYCDLDSTNIYIKEIWKPIIQNYYEGKRNEE